MLNEDNEYSDLGSFHDDSSNANNIYEDVRAIKEKRKLANKKLADVGWKKF